MNTHDDWCEKIIVDVGPGNIESPCGCKDRWKDSEIERLKAELAEARRLYDLRGQALRRPCLQCGYEPLKITLADGSVETK